MFSVCNYYGQSSNTMKLNSLIFYPNCMDMSYTYPILSIGYYLLRCVYSGYALHQGILVLRK